MSRKVKTFFQNILFCQSNKKYEMAKTTSEKEYNGEDNNASCGILQMFRRSESEARKNGKNIRPLAKAPIHVISS